ncbi:MAG: universal stress protein [Ferruginibacter sp.]
MKKILIALDYDPSAERVAREGYALADSMNAQVILVHVMADGSYYLPLDLSPVMGFSGIPPVDPLDAEGLDKLRESAREYLQHIKEYLRAADIQTLVLEGELAPSILQAARHEHADIIVVGTHGRGALEELMMGSVTKKLIKDSEIPLFVIPTRVKKG